MLRRVLVVTHIIAAKIRTWPSLKGCMKFPPKHFPVLRALPHKWKQRLICTLYSNTYVCVNTNIQLKSSRNILSSAPISYIAFTIWVLLLLLLLMSWNVWRKHYRRRYERGPSNIPFSSVRKTFFIAADVFACVHCHPILVSWSTMCISIVYHIAATTLCTTRNISNERRNSTFPIATDCC